MKRVNWEFLDCRVTQEDKDQRVLRVSKVSLEPTGKKEPGERQEKRDPEDSEDRPDHAARGDPEDPPAKQDQRVTQEVTVLQGHLVRGACQALKDQLDSQDQKARLDLLGKTDCPDTLDREERLVSKARRALPAPRAWSDLRDRPVRPDRWEIEATQDPQARLESRVFPEPREKKGPRATQALLVHLVRTAPQVQEVSPEREVCLGPWGLMA